MPATQEHTPAPKRAAWDVREKRVARRRERDRTKARRKNRTYARRRAVGKGVLVLLVLGVLLLLAFCVGDADYHATVIGWAPFVAVVTAIVLAYVYLRILAASLSMSEHLDLGDCRRGSEVPFRVSFHNNSPLVFFKIEVDFFISDLFGNVAHETSTSLSLGPFSTYEMSFAVRFDHVGTYTAGLHQVVISDFLGLFTRTLPALSKHQVDVTPRIQPLERVTFDDTATVETSKAAKAVLADSMDYAQVREYVPGDPLKTIHWKLSARTENLQTRLYEVYTDPGVAVIMDFYAPHDEALILMGMFDAVVESAFSMASYTQQQGMDTQVMYRSKDGVARKVFSWNDSEMPGLIGDMPRMSNDEADAKGAVDLLREQVMSQFGQSTLVVCSASMNSELISSLIDAKARRRSPMLIAVVPSDLDGRALDAYCKPLARLDAANIPYVIAARSEDLAVKIS